MSASSAKANIIYYLLSFREDGHQTSYEMFSKNVEAVLKMKLDVTELTLVLYHSSVMTAPDSPAFLNEDDRARAQARLIELTEPWCQRAIPVIERFNHQELSNSMAAFRNMRIRPPADFLEAWSRVALDQLPHFNGRSLSESLVALSDLAIYPGDAVMSKWKDGATKAQKDWTGAELCNVMHRLAVMDALRIAQQGPDGYSPCAGAADKIKSNSISHQRISSAQAPASLRQVISAGRWFQWPGFENVPWPSPDDEMSFFERQVARQMVAAGAKEVPSLVVPKMKHRVDLTMAFNGQNICVECDGPSHFVRDPYQHKLFFDGSTIFQSALIARIAPAIKLVRVPYDVFSSLQDSREDWRAVLSCVEKKPSGVYFLTGREQLQPLQSGGANGIACAPEAHL